MLVQQFMLVFYNTIDVCQRYKNVPGISLIDDHRKLISSNNSMFYDRSETVTGPLSIKNMFPIPELPEQNNLSYEDICYETAKDIANVNKKIRIMWSGGIDSTLIVVSFLKQKLEDRLEIALSYESISENYNFYKNHLLGKVKLIPSTEIKSLFTDDAILVGGEYNDQLLGSNLIPLFSKYYSTEDLFDKFDVDKLKKLFSVKTEKNVDRWIDLYLQTTKKSPVPIESNLDFHWWINFCCKWQGLYYRLASYTTLPVNLNNYQHFFQNEKFQRWAMLNHNQHFSGWKNYKKICKQIIYDFDKDLDYFKNKIKLESLTFVAQKNSFFNYIDDRGNRYTDLPEQEISCNNDFIKQ